MWLHYTDSPVIIAAAQLYTGTRQEEEEEEEDKWEIQEEPSEELCGPKSSSHVSNSLSTMPDFHSGLELTTFAPTARRDRVKPVKRFELGRIMRRLHTRF